MLKYGRFWVFAAAAGLPSSALAYVGPGAGITLLGALWGLLAGVAMAVGIILFWPVRIMLRKRKARLEAAQQAATTATATRSADDKGNTGG